MKVKELKKMLENVGEDREIFINTCVGSYTLEKWSKKDNFYAPDGSKVKAFYLSTED